MRPSASAPAPTPPPPQSCDTFVYVRAPARGSGPGTLFGKNSDRPSEERHEVVRLPPAEHSPDDLVRCTHVSVPQAPRTLECILSRPSWMWGCEMGANEAGVAGGNEAIQTLLSDELLSPDDGTTPVRGLLGMDLLRLALERGASARGAVEACVALLEEHGQGGACCEGDPGWTYENSFLFADGDEAYVLETAGRRHWAWERIGPGECRNISNGISIRDNWGALSKDIQKVCKEKGWWDGGTSKFDWKRAVGTGGSVEGLESCGQREAAGRVHLKEMKARSDAMPSPPSPRWWIERMTDALRDEATGICFRDRHGFCSTGSQVSWLPAAGTDKDNGPGGGGRTASHFFTGASDPLCGTPYKLFAFSDPMPPFEGEACDHGTGRLWDLWRKRALSGIALGGSLSGALSDLEEEGLSSLGDDGNESKRACLPFAAMIKREIDFLDK